MNGFIDILERSKQSFPIEQRYLNRVRFFFEKYTENSQFLYDPGHGLFALYASFPVIITPDLLHKLRFNFKNYRSQKKLQSIHPVAVNDLLFSGLCREVAQETFEMPEPIRFFLLHILKTIENKDYQLEELEVPHQILHSLAKFTKYYATQFQDQRSKYGNAAQKACQINANLYLDPAKALSDIAKDLAKARNNSQEQYRLSIIIDQVLGSWEQLERESPNRQPVKSGIPVEDQFQLLLTYSQSLKKFYLEGSSQELIQTFESLITNQITPESISVDPVWLPVPVSVIREANPGKMESVNQAFDLIGLEKKHPTGYLDLGGCGITPNSPHLSSIWKELEQLKHLEILILSNEWEEEGSIRTSRNHGEENILDQIPDCIPHLTQLKKLVICGSIAKRWSISKIDQLQTLSNLKYLNIGYNKIAKLENLKKLKKLEELYINDNLITKLEGIGNLSHLRVVDARHQQIHTIEGLKNMPNLRKLDLSHTVLSDAKALLPFITRKNNPLILVLKENAQTIKDGEINLFNVPLKVPPIETVEKGVEAIKKFFSEHEKNKKNKPIDFNPYIVGTPIHSPKDFFGRESIIQKILDGISKNNFLIEGEPRIGKTSLLYHLRFQLEQKRAGLTIFFPIYIDILATREGEFWKHLADSIFSIQGKVRTFRKIDYDFNNLLIDLEANLRDLQAKHPGKELHVVLLMDEVDKLKDYDRDTLAKLRRLFQEEERIKVVMAGGKIQKHLNDVTSPWHNLLVTLPLGSMTETSARNLIIEPVKGIYTYSPDAVSLIMSESRLKPFSIQEICFFSISGMLIRKGTSVDRIVTTKDVEMAIKKIWKEGSPASKPDGIQRDRPIGKLKSNPYSNGSVIHKDEDFYDRDDLTGIVHRREPRAYYLKGNRRIGKTSLLRQFERKLNADPLSIPVYFNLEGASNESDIARFFERAVRKANESRHLPALSMPPDFLDAFAAAIEFYKTQGLHCFLLIDEAENLLKLAEGVRSLHNELVNSHDNLTTLICATRRLWDLSKNDENDASFLDNFETHPIGCFSTEAAVALIRQTQNPDGEITASDEMVSSILFYAGTHPYLIQRLCYGLFQSGRLRPIEDQDVVLDEQIRSFFETDFNHLDESHQKVLLQCRFKQGMAPKDVEGVFKGLEATYLNEMVQLGFLRHEKNKYYLGNYFLAQWLLEKRRALRITNAGPMKTKLNVFISYSHQDEPFKDALEKHLSMLKRSNKIATWTDRAILPSQEWDEEISRQLEDADLILLLISADFMVSDYIWEKELTRAMERHHRGEARLIPIFIKPCEWKEAPFAKIQGLPKDAKPVGSPDNAAAWNDIAKGIRSVADFILKEASVTPASRTESKNASQPALILPDIKRLKDHLNNANYAALLTLLDAYFRQYPSPSFGMLKQTIKHFLAQGLMPPPASLQALDILINQLENDSRL